MDGCRWSFPSSIVVRPRISQYAVRIISIATTPFREPHSFRLPGRSISFIELLSVFLDRPIAPRLIIDHSDRELSASEHSTRIDPAQTPTGAIVSQRRNWRPHVPAGANLTRATCDGQRRVGAPLRRRTKPGIRRSAARPRFHRPRGPRQRALILVPRSPCSFGHGEGLVLFGLLGT